MTDVPLFLLAAALICNATVALGSYYLCFGQDWEVGCAVVDKDRPFFPFFFVFAMISMSHAFFVSVKDIRSPSPTRADLHRMNEMTQRMDRVIQAYCRQRVYISEVGRRMETLIARVPVAISA